MKEDVKDCTPVSRICDIGSFSFTSYVVHGCINTNKHNKKQTLLQQIQAAVKVNNTRSSIPFIQQYEICIYLVRCTRLWLSVIQLQFSLYNDVITLTYNILISMNFIVTYCFDNIIPRSNINHFLFNRMNFLQKCIRRNLWNRINISFSTVLNLIEPKYQKKDMKSLSVTTNNFSCLLYSYLKRKSGITYVAIDTPIFTLKSL